MTIYTSGTTGKPKGAQITNENIISNNIMTEAIFVPKEDDRFLCVLPLFHVYALNGVLNASIRNRTTLVLHTQFNVDKAVESLAKDNITVFAGVPTMFFYILNHPDLVIAAQDTDAIRRLFETRTSWPGTRHAQAYMRSIRRRVADRRALHEQLRRLGWKVVPVPSLADADRGINYLNGLHERKRYIMPAYGGFYAPLDQAAAEVFAAELEGVEVVPILSGESQRRVGAVHCSVSAYPQ